ncbi:MAG TPA: hypothetical protein VGJ14_15035 [Sporichthyaceae bacterium]
MRLHTRPWPPKRAVPLSMNDTGRHLQAGLAGRVAVLYPDVA